MKYKIEPDDSAESFRKVYCKDSLSWLQGKRFPAIVTSLPDMTELELSLKEYMIWVDKAAMVLQNAVDENGCIIFYQTNRKFKGTILDKEFVLTTTFYKYGFKKVFQKIVLRKAPGVIDLYRLSFTSMFCFSKTITAGLGYPDVIYAGRFLTTNAMGLNACSLAINFLKKIEPKVIIDPFCGVGTVLAMANFYGIRAIGIDINPDNVKKAKTLTVTANVNGSFD